MALNGATCNGVGQVMSHVGATATAVDGGEARCVGSLFQHETLTAFLKRAALSTAYDLRPPRLKVAPRLTWRLARHLLSSAEARRKLPDPAGALPGAEGVAGFCDDMSVATLRAAYLSGLFPLSHFGPQRWCAPPFRSVLEICEFRLRDELRRKLKKRSFRVTFDREPVAVMRACAGPREGQWPLTWITPDVIEAYHRLYQAGDMHSVEVWDSNSQLVGGLFGTVVGPCFVVESLFHKAANSSKYGLAVIIAHLQAWGFTHVDYKLHNPHIEALGFREIPRDDFVRIVAASRPASGELGQWHVDAALDLGSWRPAQGAPKRRA